MSNHTLTTAPTQTDSRRGASATPTHRCAPSGPSVLWAWWWSPWLAWPFAAASTLDKVTRKTTHIRWYWKETLPHALLALMLPVALIAGLATHRQPSLLILLSTGYWGLVNTAALAAFVSRGWFGTTPVRAPAVGGARAKHGSRRPRRCSRSTRRWRRCAPAPDPRLDVAVTLRNAWHSVLTCDFFSSPFGGNSAPAAACSRETSTEKKPSSRRRGVT